MKRRLWLVGLSTAVACLAFSLALVVGAHGAPPPSHPAPGSNWKVFGDGTWTAGAGNESRFGLVTSSDSSGSYGGIDLARLPTTDPSAISALSFQFNANLTGASGGSPRLVVGFSDGSYPNLRPLNWTAGTWTTVDGMTGNNWDDQGGTCGYQYSVTWASIVACHTGQTITDIFVVNDSGWLYPGGEQVVVDNVTVNTLVATGPGNNS